MVEIKVSLYLCSKLKPCFSLIYNRRLDRWVTGREILTFSHKLEGNVVGEHTLGTGWAGYHAGVVAPVWWVHLGDVQVACYLGDKSPLVQRDEAGEVIEHPSKWQSAYTDREKRCLSIKGFNCSHTLKKAKGTWYEARLLWVRILHARQN